MNDIDQGGFYTFDDKIYLTLNQKAVDHSHANNPAVTIDNGSPPQAVGQSNV